jgi:hypothetical protein
MDPRERVEALLAAAASYASVVSASYDEVVLEVAHRAKDADSFGKLNIGALTAWKRLRADTPWMAKLMSLPDLDVRAHTGAAVSAARDTSMEPGAAAAAARAALSQLPGFDRGDALASALCFAAAPDRLAVYDKRAHSGLTRVGLARDHRPGRYGRYITLLEQCRDELDQAGRAFTARQVDTALYQLGGQP